MPGYTPEIPFQREFRGVGSQNESRGEQNKSGEEKSSG